MLSVVSGVSHILSQPHCRSGLETGAVRTLRVSLVLDVSYAPRSDFANQFALNPCAGPGYSCCSASSDMDRKRTLVSRASQHRRSQNSARLTSRFDSRKVKQLEHCERAEFRVRVLPRHLELWILSLVWQVFSNEVSRKSILGSPRGLSHCLKYRPSRTPLGSPFRWYRAWQVRRLRQVRKLSSSLRPCNFGSEILYKELVGRLGFGLTAKLLASQLFASVTFNGIHTWARSTRHQKRSSNHSCQIL